MKKVLVVIPAYNEEKNIERVVDNLISNYGQYDYVVVNDGSTDGTRKVCRKNGYNLLDLPVNLGLGGAIKSGMKYANYNQYEYVLQFDGDGQHDVTYVSTICEPIIQNQADMCIGSRYLDDTTSSFKSTFMRRLRKKHNILYNKTIFKTKNNRSDNRI